MVIIALKSNRIGTRVITHVCLLCIKSLFSSPIQTRHSSAPLLSQNSRSGGRRGSEVQGHLWLQSMSEASLVYMRPYLQINKQTRKIEGLILF